MRDYQIEFIKEENFPLLNHWFLERNFPPPNWEVMPPTGVLVSYQGKPMAAAFMYITDARVACIAHLVSDPSAPKIPRNDAVDVAVYQLMEIGMKLGMKMVTCSTNIEKLGARFEDIGFQKTDEKVNHYRRFLCP